MQQAVHFASGDRCRQHQTRTLDVIDCTIGAMLRIRTIALVIRSALFPLDEMHT
jgi:hypothetical protein